VAVLYAVLGLYYYMRIANPMFMRQATDPDPVVISPGMQIALAVTAIGTVGIGIFPEFFIRAAGWSLGMQQTGTSLLGLLR
ncbi:MAG: NADH-quinone oxidoreductase subunit N, partial [Terriglobales bacterium]